MYFQFDYRFLIFLVPIDCCSSTAIKYRRIYYRLRRVYIYDITLRPQVSQVTGSSKKAWIVFTI